MKEIFFALLVLFLNGCVMKPDIVSLHTTDINIIVKNDALHFKTELLQRVNTPYNTNSSNILILSVIKNHVENSKYKKKAYDEGTYNYKICYLQTHHFKIDMKYSKNNKMILKEDVKVIIENDSCDDYTFENGYESYVVKRAVDKIFEKINAIEQN